MVGRPIFHHVAHGRGHHDADLPPQKTVPPKVDGDKVSRKWPAVDSAQGAYCRSVRWDPTREGAEIVGTFQASEARDQGRAPGGRPGNEVAVAARRRRGPGVKAPVDRANTAYSNVGRQGLREGRSKVVRLGGLTCRE